MYDFKNIVFESNDPRTTINFVDTFVNDMHERVLQNNSLQVDVIGNSLGSWLAFNYSVRYPVAHAVFNSGGSAAEMLFAAIRGSFLKTKVLYESQGFDVSTLKHLWRSIDSIALGKKLKAKQSMFLWSPNDGVIPKRGTQELIKSMQASGHKLQVVKGNGRHIPTVFVNAHRLKNIQRFLST